MRHEEDDGEKRECSTDYTAAHPEQTLMQSRAGAFQRNERAGDQGGVDPEPVNRHIRDVTKHRCERDFECEMHVCRIGERVGHKKAFRSWLMCRWARRVWQKQ